MKRSLTAVAVGLACAAGSAPPALAARAYADAHQESCLARIIDGPDRVHDTRWDRPEELEHLGEYDSIHWQVDTAGSPCLRSTRRKDLAYQVVLRLRPESARRIAADIRRTSGWQAAERVNASLDSIYPGTPRIRPALRAYVRPDAEWMHDNYYDSRQAGSRWHTTYLDTGTSVAVVTFPPGD